ncbi:nuclear transport factor 2 family protein [Rhizobium sp. S153]|uniref:Nuclear transport factor 2 family protein n=1 Tax=Ciceribacter sichuanensis TaxID=2949647 RepID=A0ABT0V1Y8_9HYPH|nr:nuclear transport factor 2 family protein [Ciceribacter sp. S153]MCM2399876.1 nuclear transport factor 2 family protein [Ciceribacter sp. S153]
MPITLPKPIAAYFAADRIDSAAMTQCFTENAIVVDEGKTHTGRAAIRRWKSNASTKFDYVSEPIAVTEKDGSIVVTGRVTGNFPGSPVDLKYTFVLEGEAIARLEITL